jgi:hypothetical protein
MIAVEAEMVSKARNLWGERRESVWPTVTLVGLCGYFLAVLAGLAPWVTVDPNFLLRWVGSVLLVAALIGATEGLMFRRGPDAIFDRWLEAIDGGGSRRWPALALVALFFALAGWALLWALGLPLFLLESRFVLDPRSGLGIGGSLVFGIVCAGSLVVALRATRASGWPTSGAAGDQARDGMS